MIEFQSRDNMMEKVAATCLENPIWEPVGCIPWVAKSHIRLSHFITTFCMHWEQKWQPPLQQFLSWRTRMWSLVGCCLWASHRVGHHCSYLVAVDNTWLFQNHIMLFGAGLHLLCHLLGLSCPYVAILPWVSGFTCITTRHD